MSKLTFGVSQKLLLIVWLLALTVWALWSYHAQQMALQEIRLWLELSSESSSTDASAGEPVPKEGIVGTGQITNRATIEDQCTGSVPPESLQSTVGRHGRDFFDCVAAQPSTAETVEGLVDIRVRLGSDGEVLRVQMHAADYHQELFACLDERVRSWRFPSPAGGCAEVSIPFAVSGPQ